MIANILGGKEYWRWALSWNDNLLKGNERIRTHNLLLGQGRSISDIWLHFQGSHTCKLKPLPGGKNPEIIRDFREISCWRTFPLEYSQLTEVQDSGGQLCVNFVKFPEIVAFLKSWQDSDCVGVGYCNNENKDYTRFFYQKLFTISTKCLNCFLFCRCKNYNVMSSQWSQSKCCWFKT